MRKCKACGGAFASTKPTDEICYPCENALKRLNGYAIPVVRCKDCVLHNSCIPEETFNFSGIENPFCCVGKKVQNDL